MSGDELPEGWSASGIDQLCHRVTDGTHFSPKEQNRRGGYKYVTAKNIREWGLDLSDVTYVSEAIHRSIFQRCNPEKDDVLYIKDGATAGIAILNPLDEEFSLLSSVALLKPDRSQLDPSFLKWYLMSPAGRRAMLDQVTGSAITRLTLEIIRKSVIPMPPLPEQKRIVAKVEELLARVNAARERLTRVPAILKCFRQAVLAAASEGRLTERWRRDRALPDFGEARLGDHCVDSFYGPRFGRDEYTAAGTPTVRTTDFLETGEIDIQSLLKAPRVLVPEARREKFLLQAGDLLVTRTGSVGKMAIFRGGSEAIPSAYVIRFRFSQNLIPDFVQICLLSPRWQELLGLGSTAVTQPNINAEAIKSLPIPLPTPDEQQEIIRRIEALFKVAEKIEKRVTVATARAEKLTQAILAKAFRGELVPTEADLARRGMI